MRPRKPSQSSSCMYFCEVTWPYLSQRAKLHWIPAKGARGDQYCEWKKITFTISLIRAFKLKIRVFWASLMSTETGVKAKWKDICSTNQRLNELSRSPMGSDEEQNNFSCVLHDLPMFEVYLLLMLKGPLLIQGLEMLAPLSRRAVRGRATPWLWYMSVEVDSVTFAHDPIRIFLLHSCFIQKNFIWLLRINPSQAIISHTNSLW